MNLEVIEDKWWDITDYLPGLKKIAIKRDSQKSNFSSTKNWTINNSTHFTGVCAEFCISLETGIKFNTELIVTGDPGYDFKKHDITYDAKGATYWKSPDLKEFTNRKKWADKYILVAIKDFYLVRVVGWASRDQLINAPRKNYGYGDMLSLTINDLRNFDQLGLPVELLRNKYVTH